MISMRILMAAGALMLVPVAAHAQSGQPHTTAQTSAAQTGGGAKPASTPSPAVALDVSGKPPAPQQAAPNTAPDKPA